MIASLILMSLPYGVAMNFSDGVQIFTSYYSYFSMMPIGYANWFPMLTAVLSIIVLVQLIVQLKNKSIVKPVPVCLAIAIITSLTSWLFGSFTIIGLIILLLHAAALVMQIVYKKTL